jgi:hypothetical protein
MRRSVYRQNRWIMVVCRVLHMMNPWRRYHWFKTAQFIDFLLVKNTFIEPYYFYIEHVLRWYSIFSLQSIDCRIEMKSDLWSMIFIVLWRCQWIRVMETVINNQDTFSPENDYKNIWRHENETLRFHVSMLTNNNHFALEIMIIDIANWCFIE